MTLSLTPREDETIAGAGRALRSGSLTCVGLVESCLAKIAEWEPKVHAWVTITEESALKRAHELDQMLTNGTDLGPLHGIPIGVKDIIDVRGLETQAGAVGWSHGPADEDAVIVRDLTLAGAIILGKTVTTSYAFLDPPPTRNPWNLTRTPGGSSSGSAAAVATGMCLAAIGSQTVGSLTRPASFCGVASHKPAEPRIRFDDLLKGVMPLAQSLDMTGLMARSVEDLAVFEARWQAHGWLDAIQKPTRLRVLLGPFRDRAEPAMRLAFGRAVEQWRAAGALVDEIEPPVFFSRIWTSLRIILAAEAASVHASRKARMPDTYPPKISALIDEGCEVEAVDYLEALQFREEVLSYRFDGDREVDALITPAALGGATGLESTGDAIFNGPWNFLCRETISFPIGLSETGMPLAVQLILPRPSADSSLFPTALWCERVIQDNLRKEQG